MFWKFGNDALILKMIYDLRVLMIEVIWFKMSKHEDMFHFLIEFYVSSKLNRTFNSLSNPQPSSFACYWIWTDDVHCKYWNAVFVSYLFQARMMARAFQIWLHGNLLKTLSALILPSSLPERIKSMQLTKSLTDKVMLSCYTFFIKLKNCVTIKSIYEKIF